jgi:hypothetical protein
LVNAARWSLAIGLWLVALTPIRAESDVPRAWANVGTEKTPFCLFLNGDGTANCDGGFSNWNPIRWRYVSNTRTISFEISRLRPADTAGIARDHVGEIASPELPRLIHEAFELRNIFNASAGTARHRQRTDFRK